MVIEFTRLTSKQLKRAAVLQGKIEALEMQLSNLLDSGSKTDSTPAQPRKAQPGKRKMSRAARAKISRGQKARWAERKLARKPAKAAQGS
jgi:hypothetical protein